ncbi:hypothetical protein EQO05_14010 [Methanosarcina sp. MSH10X1]|nr:hypothetical protein EQO05_14010 [Methanosarcina sp. MSH10X1]
MPFYPRTAIELNHNAGLRIKTHVLPGRSTGMAVGRRGAESNAISTARLGYLAVPINGKYREYCK